MTLISHKTAGLEFPCKWAKNDIDLKKIRAFQVYLRRVIRIETLMLWTSGGKLRTGIVC